MKEIKDAYESWYFDGVNVFPCVLFQLIDSSDKHFLSLVLINFIRIIFPKVAEKL